MPPFMHSNSSSWLYRVEEQFRTDGSGRQSEISLSREIFLHQLLLEVRTQILEPYTVLLDDLIRTVQQVVDSARAVKRASLPAHPINSLQLEEAAEGEISAVTRRRPIYHHKKQLPPTVRQGHPELSTPLLLRPSKKRRRRRPTAQAAVAAEEPRSPKPVGFYVSDTISSRMMLIDTGAVRSVFLPSREDRKCPPDLAASLRAANGSPILSYSTKLLSVSILGQRYSWNFIIADVRTPLLGVDFLAHFGLAVDVGCKRLLDTDFCQSLLLLMGPSAPAICSVAPHQYAQLLKEFPDVFKPKLRQAPVALEDIPKTAIISPFGSYVFTFSTFGQRNVGATFQRLMDSILRDLNFCRAFSLTKAALAEATALAHQDPSARLQLMTDASNVACGAVLEQVVAGAPHPIPFFSRKFSPAESCYSTFDRELCSVYRAYLPGRKNPVADTLTRIELNVVQLGIDYNDLAQEQTTDPEIPAYRTAITSLRWKDVHLAPGEPSLLSDISTGHPRLLVPASRRWLVFDVIHGLSHPASRMTVKLLAEKFVWHANGLVERFHRSLKASLMACCTAEDWKYQLSWVLLGLRTAPRANGDPSATEKVYEEPLVVPGELIMEDCHNLTVQRLRDTVRKFAPCQQTYTDKTSSFTPPGLSSTTHVFDTVRPTLTRLYKGPFCVLERNDKAFRLAIHGMDDWVPVDRLKPTLLEEDVNGTTQRPPQEPSPPQPAQPKRKSWPLPEGPGPRQCQPASSHCTPQLTSQSRGTLQWPSRYLI
ncbi:uncharacterized protein [Macrobrachium rosenbergii]|uniref:uncharacterized protein n=1 Tax=Macrobrachium rosenbergii TaxID=79674 RepID=UPI0034D6410B